jgi:two-component system, OmpR family, sensor histidine kinase MprB
VRPRVPWRERSLRTRLTVLVAGAMAAAVVVMWLSTWLLLRANLYVEFEE